MLHRRNGDDDRRGQGLDADTAIADARLSLEAPEVLERRAGAGRRGLVSQTPTGEISFVSVAAAVVRPLRGEVLRPGEPAEKLLFEGDEDPSTLHLAACSEGHVLGIVSVIADGYPRSPAPGDWRVRGMATEPAMRNRGIGGQMLSRCEMHARLQGATRLWCNARVGARTLYERIGMTVEGELFEIAGIGAHYLMSKQLGQPARRGRLLS